MREEQVKEARRKFLGARLWQYTEGMPDEMAISVQVRAVGGGINLTLGNLRALKADLERNDTPELLTACEEAYRLLDAEWGHADAQYQPVALTAMTILRAAIAKARGA